LPHQADPEDAEKTPEQGAALGCTCEGVEMLIRTLDQVVRIVVVAQRWELCRLECGDLRCLENDRVEEEVEEEGDDGGRLLFVRLFLRVEWVEGNVWVRFEDGQQEATCKSKTDLNPEHGTAFIDWDEVVGDQGPDIAVEVTGKDGEQG
jgi:hypothetical protein